MFTGTSHQELPRRNFLTLRIVGAVTPLGSETDPGATLDRVNFSRQRAKVGGGKETIACSHTLIHYALEAGKGSEARVTPRAAAPILGSKGDGDAQKGGWNRGRAHDPIRILAIEQSLELSLKVRGFAVLLCGGERVHRRAVVIPEVRDKCRR